MRMYVQLDVEWPGNRKRIRAGLEASAVHAICLCLAKRSSRDGWVARDELGLYGATDEHLDRLVDLELLDADGEWVRPHDWLEVNLSSERIRAEKADKARAANHARWQHPGAYESCDKCHKPRSSEPDPVGVHTESVGIPATPSTGSEQEPEQQPQTEDPPSLIDRIVDGVFVKVLAEKQRRGEPITSPEGFRKWWDANQANACRTRAAWMLEHYDVPTLTQQVSFVLSPVVPQWASPYLKREDPAA